MRRMQSASANSRNRLPSGEFGGVSARVSVHQSRGGVWSVFGGAAQLLHVPPGAGLQYGSLMELRGSTLFCYT